MHTSTLTIRLPQEQRATLKETAKRLKKSESDVIRELLTREFEQVSFGERASEFTGCLESSPSAPAEPDSFRDAIKRNNWRAK
jgi:predicted CopG family antitoxin